MVVSNFVPKHLPGKQADCLAVLLQSMRWEMDPFAVAQETYFVNDGMAYEAHPVNAISRASLRRDPNSSDLGGRERTRHLTSIFPFAISVALGGIATIAKVLLGILLLIGAKVRLLRF
jgi:hypothetical protein